MNAISPHRVLVAGSGVAGLEALLAIRKLAKDRVELELLCPQQVLNYRPLTVAEPFGEGEPPEIDVRKLVDDVGAMHRPGVLTKVDPEQKTVLTSRGQTLRYDTLVIATGAVRLPAVPGALTFSERRDIAPLKRLLGEVEQGRVTKIGFVVPSGAGWPLPIYELALLTSTWAERHGQTSVEITLATPEWGPLALFGEAGSMSVRELLDRHHITFVPSSYPVRFEKGTLELAPSRRLTLDRVVALPQIEGPQIAGLPSEAHGFIPTDLHGLVSGVSDVYAAGDATTFPIKQGGLAAQQADAVARRIAARVAGTVEAETDPFRPVLRALLLTGGEPCFLQAELIGGQGAASLAAAEALWSPSGKIAAAELGPYLARKRP